MTPIAISVTDVTKTYVKSSEPGKTLKERLLSWRQATVTTFDALSDLSFAVHSGETFGILGHNGSGKSTLLKCIAGTIAPNSGSVQIRGRLSALLELGAGFHPDLTGRENVYLNGAILGLSKSQLDGLYDSIISFAELEGFADTQVKYYSSGMYARLGFAIAINVEPDILLVDEVLSVGDEAFQGKCLEKIAEFQRAGRTICIVTHSPDMVQSICNRALVLDHGKLIHLGDVGEAANAYRRSLGLETQPVIPSTPIVVEPATPARPPLQVLDSQFVSATDDHCHLGPTDDLKISTRLRADDDVTVACSIALTQSSSDGTISATTKALVDEHLIIPAGDTTLEIDVSHPTLAPGTYTATTTFDPMTTNPQTNDILSCDVKFTVGSHGDDSDLNGWDTKLSLHTDGRLAATQVDPMTVDGSTARPSMTASPRP